MSRYRFTGAWRIEAEPEHVFAALAEAEHYPNWWPGIIATRRIDDRSGEIRLRSLVPVEVVFVATQEAVDPAAGTLVARFTGDLEGTGRWEVSGRDHSTVARYEEEFAVRAKAARAAGVLARPVIRANHEHVMREGERGLRRHLGRL